VAWCLAETETQAVDRSSIPSEPFAYLRLRREDYSDDDIGEWATGLRATLESGRDAFVYFKHEEGAAAPRFAARLNEVLEPPSVAGFLD
jgi:uncharacterized protein YecE (DUF72 family)